MQYLVSVIHDQIPGGADPDEMAAIDVFDDRLHNRKVEVRPFQ